MNTAEFDVDVAVVGAGPTGLALACELRLAGVTCRVLERRAEVATAVCALENARTRGRRRDARP